MDRLAVFVDAGYFFAAGSQAAYSAVLPRRHIRIRSAPNLLNDLAMRATQLARDLPLLRIYWYDAMPGPRLSLEQSTLAMLPGIKPRLGALKQARDAMEIKGKGEMHTFLLAAGGRIPDGWSKVLRSGGLARRHDDARHRAARRHVALCQITNGINAETSDRYFASLLSKIAESARELP